MLVQYIPKETSCWWCWCCNTGIHLTVDVPLAEATWAPANTHMVSVVHPKAVQKDVKNMMCLCSLSVGGSTIIGNTGVSED